MQCYHCKKQIDNDAKFCNFCGSVVEKKEEKTGAVDLYFKNRDEELLQEAKRMANNAMLQGIGWFIVGLIITGITYAVADEGGTYYVLWGAMLVGVYMFLRGLYYKLFPRQLLGKAAEKQKQESDK